MYLPWYIQSSLLPHKCNMVYCRYSIVTLNYSQTLLAGTLALILVAGLGNQAFAGASISSCTIEPSMLEFQLGSGEATDPFVIQIQCDEIIEAMDLEQTCSPVNLTTFQNEVGHGTDTRTFEVVVTNSGDTSEQHCAVTFFPEDEQGDVFPVVLELWINEPKPVAGELLTLDSSALVMTGLSSSAIWMVPIVAGVASAGVYLIKTRSQRD